jgi:hypothetical protein
LCKNGKVATISSEEIAPEISPKVSTVFFIDLSLLFLRFRETWFNAPEI